MDRRFFSFADAQSLRRSPRYVRVKLMRSGVLRLLGATLALMLRQQIASSQDDPGTPLAVGAASCGALNEAGRTGKDNVVYMRLVTWISGYVAAYDEYNSPILVEGKPSFSITEWLDTYCQSNPEANLHDAATALATALETEVLKSGQYCGVATRKSCLR